MDCELLFAAATLHDTGLVTATGDVDFTLTSSRLARDVAEDVGLSTASTHVMQTAVTMHHSPRGPAVVGTGRVPAVRRRCGRPRRSAFLGASRRPGMRGVVADEALDLLRLPHDQRPVRPLGVRAEMAPPEGGYDLPRTHGGPGMP